MKKTAKPCGKMGRIKEEDVCIPWRPKPCCFRWMKRAMSCSLIRRKNGREYIKNAGETWKLIYAEGIRTERPVYAAQQCCRIEREADGLNVYYDKLHSDDRELEISLRLCYRAEGEFLSARAYIENRSDVPVVEFQFTPVSGVQTLSGESEDYIAWPYKLGRKVRRPAFSHLSVDSGFRPYEMPEQIHTDLNVLYPGVGSMQWYDWCNEEEGLYVGHHDTDHETLCLRAERAVKENTLRLGVIRYPFCDGGESWSSAPLVYAFHDGDWHAGAKLYRQWLAESGAWHAPKVSDWAKEFQGWLRVIMKPHHCEINWDYSQIPMLFDKAQAAGLNTLFLLGWEQGGFARMWPDFKVAEDMGGREALQKGIDYVHSKGGKVLLFLSYYLIDHQSDFYKYEGGDQCTIKTIWGEDLPFAETYCGEGTYRKLANPPMPMYAACPSTEGWQKKMLEVTRYCMDLGADGVLYDLGGRNASFCYAKDHGHDKPSRSHCGKEDRYKELRSLVKSYGEDKITLMEYNVDIYGQHMDIVQSSAIKPAGKYLSELYRYTFPEICVTNRGMSLDETGYIENINYTFIMGMSFDLTIFRCLGLPDEIPNYTAYMQRALELRRANPEHLIRGKFVDTDGFAADHPALRCKGYLASDGSLGVACWNTAGESVSFTLTGENGTARSETMAPNSIDFFIL